jgi:hypothetical protein
MTHVHAGQCDEITLSARPNPAMKSWICMRSIIDTRPVVPDALAGSVQQHERHWIRASTVTR